MKTARKTNRFFKGMVVLLVFAVSFAVGGLLTQWGLASFQVSRDGGKDIATDEMPGRLNVLLMGIDAREGETDARTDSMMLVSIDRSTQKVAVVSIPRDTLVEIPGHGSNKINSANALGGADLARQTAEELLGVEIPYYVKTNFEGFKDIVDTLGGVNINVEKRMYYPAEDIDLQAGPQRLDGWHALGYVRYRNDALGDIARVSRQQTFIVALAKEMLRARTIIKLPALVPQLMDAVETNLGIKDALFLTRAASNMEAENIASATLPGSFLNYKGASYWKMDVEKSQDILNDLFQGVKVATITGPDINVPAANKSGSKQVKTEKTVPKEPEEQQPAAQGDVNSNSDPSGTSGTTGTTGTTDTTGTSGATGTTSTSDPSGATGTGSVPPSGSGTPPASSAAPTPVVPGAEQLTPQTPAPTGSGSTQPAAQSLPGSAG